MKNIIIAMALIALWSCGSDHELSKSVFKPDPNFPELPQYSEWGYNTFGAYYGRESFISNEQDVPLSITNHNNLTSFDFQGQLGEYSYYSTGARFSMTLTLSDFHPESYEDLLALHETTFDLTDPQFTIQIKGEDGVIYPAEILEGQFKVKRAQTLFVDEEKQQVILSGVFNFKAVIDGEPVTVSEGRFDVGVSALNFFKY